MPIDLFSPSHFLYIPSNYPGYKNRSNVLSDRIFRALFGVTSNVCTIIWEKLEVNVTTDKDPNHLLWALLFLKVYSTEEVHSSLVGTTVKTFRKWSIPMVERMSSLNTVSILALKFNINFILSIFNFKIYIY